MWGHIFPFLNWLPLLNRDSLKSDFMAGLTGAVIVLPQGVAFAMIAGLPPEYGLYTAMVTPVLAALFGSSYHLISGPTTAISLVVFASLAKYAEAGSETFIQLAILLCFMAGVIQLVFGLVRAGKLVGFVSHTVVTGFTAGAAILIITSQMKHVLGLQLSSGLSFFQSWVAIGQGLSLINWWVFAVGGGTLLMALLIQRFLPKWPYMLIAMILGSLLNLLLDGQSKGVMLVGEIPAHLPAMSLPNLSWEHVRLLSSDALAIALLGLIEAVSIAKAIAMQSQQRIDANQEFIGQGISNLVASFFSCYAGSGSFTRSGVNYQSGAKTPMAAIFAAIILALLLLLLAPYAAYLPLPAMGGIILLVGFKLIDVSYIKTIIKADWREALVLLTTFLATLLLDLEFAIYLGVLLSLAFFLNRMSRPHIGPVKIDIQDSEGDFQRIHITGPLYFGALEYLGDQFQLLLGENPKIILDADNIHYLDMAGAEFLAHQALACRKLGGFLRIENLAEEAHELIAKLELEEELGISVESLARVASH
ncbi:MAG: SulP family inorganic anion transporter [Bacteroidota bacterium]